MTVQEIIDQALRQGDNVSPTSADYLERRRLALSFLRELVDEVWWLRDWPWKKTSATVTVPPGLGYTNLPIDFNSLGVYGGVYGANGSKLEDVPESVIFDLNQGSYSTDAPGYFSIHTQDDVTRIGRITIPTTGGAAVTLTILYQANPPHLMDMGDLASAPTRDVSAFAFDAVAGIATAASTAHGFATGQRVVITDAGLGDYAGGFVITVLDQNTFTFLPGTTPSDTPAGTATLDIDRANRAVLRVPEKYHQTVLTWGLRAKLRESKGDARFEFAQGEFAKGLTHMLKEEARFQGSFRRLPSFFGSDRSRY